MVVKLSEAYTQMNLGLGPDSSGLIKAFAVATTFPNTCVYVCLSAFAEE